MTNRSGDNDMVLKGAAVVGAIGVLIANLLLIFGGATKEQINTLSANFHDFSVSVDSRLRIVENAQVKQIEQISNAQSTIKDIQFDLSEIHKASREQLAPGRK